MQDAVAQTRSVRDSVALRLGAPLPLATHHRWHPYSMLFTSPMGTSTAWHFDADGLRAVVNPSAKGTRQFIQPHAHGVFSDDAKRNTITASDQHLKALSSSYNLTFKHVTTGERRCVRESQAHVARYH
jgi:hypothetical protein